jgi:hypothetical protein
MSLKYKVKSWMLEVSLWDNHKEKILKLKLSLTTKNLTKTHKQKCITNY